VKTTRRASRTRSTRALKALMVVLRRGASSRRRIGHGLTYSIVDRVGKVASFGSTKWLGVLAWCPCRNPALYWSRVEGDTRLCRRTQT
jgi:hypothetical protein